MKAMKAQYRYSFILSLTSALDGLCGQRHVRPIYRRERPSTHSIRGWVTQGPVWTGAVNIALQRNSIPGPSSP